MRICFSNLLLILISSYLITACNKGEVLSHDLNVQYIETTNVVIYPANAFPHFDQNDLNEPDIYPHFVNFTNPIQINADFKEDLTQYLKKNKIHLVPDSNTYRLVITGISFHESNNRQSYIDSCGFGYPSAYVYYSDYQVTAHASLYKGNTLIENFTESDSGRERLKSTTDACNKPDIGWPIQSLSTVASTVAKKIRARVSRKLRELVG